MLLEAQNEVWCQKYNEKAKYDLVLCILMWRNNHLWYLIVRREQMVCCGFGECLLKPTIWTSFSTVSFMTLLQVPVLSKLFFQTLLSRQHFQLGSHTNSASGKLFFLNKNNYQIIVILTNTPCSRSMFSTVVILEGKLLIMYLVTRSLGFAL